MPPVREQQVLPRSPFRDISTSVANTPLSTIDGSHTPDIMWKGTVSSPIVVAGVSMLPRQEQPSASYIGRVERQR
jgi:hypothetical protein